MLSLIGMGLTLKDITLKGLERVKRSDQVFVELYTSVLPDFNKNKLEEIISKKFKILKREDLEQRSRELLKKAKDRNVALLIPGDPLTATTHIELILEAKKQQIETEVIHASSILTAAIGESGLQAYKFGQPCSISLPQEGFEPETPYSVIKENQRRGLHTLLFLDVKAEEKKHLTPIKALNFLLKIEDRRKEGVISKDMLAIVLSRIGSGEQEIVAEKIGKLIRKDFGDPPYTLVIPGKLHFKEKEFLTTLLS